MKEIYTWRKYIYRKKYKVEIDIKKHICRRIETKKRYKYRKKIYIEGYRHKKTEKRDELFLI